MEGSVGGKGSHDRKNDFLSHLHLKGGGEGAGWEARFVFIHSEGEEYGDGDEGKNRGKDLEFH